MPDNSSSTPTEAAAMRKRRAAIDALRAEHGVGVYGTDDPDLRRDIAKALAEIGAGDILVFSFTLNPK